MEGDYVGRHGVMVANTIVHSRRNELIPVRLFNPHDIPVTVKKGEQIAKLEEAEPCTSTTGISTISVGTELSLEEKEALWDIVLKVGNHISPAEREQLFSVLLEYKDAFALHEHDSGYTSVTKHKIDMGNSSPVHCSPHRIPQARKEKVRKLTQEMLEKGVTQLSNSPWSSPIVLAKKKNGSVRFCIDYRKVNAITRKDAYPLPRIDETLDTLAGSKLYTTLDLKTGYWQVEVENEDRAKTTFRLRGVL